jgi:hypothetical protein
VKPSRQVGREDVGRGVEGGWEEGRERRWLGRVGCQGLGVQGGCEVWQLAALRA